AHEEGVVTRAVELVVKEAIGLPRLEAKNTIDGYLELVRDGVLCVIGPLITDNSIALAPVIDQAGVSAVTWTGTDRYHGEYCFNLGNGGLAEEAAMMAAWIRRQGHRTVGMIHELSPGGVEYASNFRYYAARAGLAVLLEAYTTQAPDDLAAVLRQARARPLRRPPRQAPRPHRHRAQLRHGAADRRGPRARPAAHAARREGGAGEGAPAAGRQRRAAHAHEPWPVRPQGVQGRLARDPEDRGRTDGVRGATRGWVNGRWMW